MFQLGGGVSALRRYFSLLKVFQLGGGVSAWWRCFSLGGEVFKLGGDVPA